MEEQKIRNDISSMLLHISRHVFVYYAKWRIILQNIISKIVLSLKQLHIESPAVDLNSLELISSSSVCILTILSCITSDCIHVVLRTPTAI